MWLQGVNDYECMCNVLKDGMHVNWLIRIQGACVDGLWKTCEGMIKVNE